MPITISDVAREAGVSTSTVSKVLNNWTTISPATTERIHEAIKKLNYTPNARAVSFARQSTQNIVFLTSLGKDEAYNNPHMFDIMCGVNKELSRHHYSLTLVDTSEETEPGSTVKQVMAQKCSDGMIIHGSAINREIATLIVQQQFPHIIIGHPGFESQLCWVDTNHALAGQMAAEHFLDCGYTNAAFIGGKKTDYISIQRQKGFIGAMYDYGYQIPSELVCYTDSSKEESYQAALHLLALKKLPRGIICENNTIAVGVIKAIEELHLHIPTDIALLTFDAYPYSKVIDPTPTLVDINVYDMGIQAGMMMIRKIENPSLQIQIYTTLPVINIGKTTEVDIHGRKNKY